MDYGINWVVCKYVCLGLFKLSSEEVVDPSVVKVGLALVVSDVVREVELRKNNG